MRCFVTLSVTMIQYQFYFHLYLYQLLKLKKQTERIYKHLYLKYFKRTCLRNLIFFTLKMFSYKSNSWKFNSILV